MNFTVAVELFYLLDIMLLYLLLVGQNSQFNILLRSFYFEKNQINFTLN